MPKDSGKNQKETTKARIRVIREFDEAAVALCNVHDTFMDELKMHSKSVELMDRYLQDLLKIVDRASSPGKGKQRESQKLRQRKSYISSQAVIGAAQSFFIEKEVEIIDRLLKNPHLPFEERVFGLPVNIHNVGKMKWMAAEYRNAIPVIASTYESFAADLGAFSEKLPVPFREYRQKGADYRAVCADILRTVESSSTEDDLRDLTRETFEKIRARYAPRLLPKK